GDNFDVSGEGFDDNIAFVFDGFKGSGDGFPVDVIVARGAAVAAAGVEVAEQFAGFANRFSLVLLLDVHVKGVEMKLERRAADISDHLQPLVAGIDEIGLKAVERFETDLAAFAFRVITEGAQI